MHHVVRWHKIPSVLHSYSIRMDANAAKLGTDNTGTWINLNWSLRNFVYFQKFCAHCWLLSWQACCTLCYPELSATSIILRKWETLDISPILIAITIKIQKYLQSKCLRIQKSLKLDTLFEPNKKNVGISWACYSCGEYTGAVHL
jgi:hypothetical protein